MNTLSRILLTDINCFPRVQFDRVQTMIASRKGGKASLSSTNYYLLSGLDILVCSECGSRLVGKTDNRSGKRYYYCPKHKCKECSMVDIKQRNWRILSPNDWPMRYISIRIW